MRVLSIVFVLFLYVQSSWAGGLELSGLGHLNKADSKFAMKAWPKIKAALPGLDAYAKDLQVVGVDKAATGRGLTFQIKVADRPSVIPTVFKSNGNYCYIDIDQRAKEVTISKRACMSVATKINAFDPALSASLKGGPLVLALD